MGLLLQGDSNKKRSLAPLYDDLREIKSRSERVSLPLMTPNLECKLSMS